MAACRCAVADVVGVVSEVLNRGRSSIHACGVGAATPPLLDAAVAKPDLGRAGVAGAVSDVRFVGVRDSIGRLHVTTILHPLVFVQIRRNPSARFSRIE